MKEAYIIDGIRTPIGNYKGTLSAIRTDDLGATSHLRNSKKKFRDSKRCL